MSEPSDFEPAVLAFDGGSTKTDAVLVSRLGAVLGRAQVGPSNHQLVGLEGTVQALSEAFAAVTADAQRSDAPSPLCPTGVYCLAGIDLPVDEEKLAPLSSDLIRVGRTSSVSSAIDQFFALSGEIWVLVAALAKPDISWLLE